MIYLDHWLICIQIAWRTLLVVDGILNQGLRPVSFI